MSDDPTQSVKRIINSNGRADWHASTIYEDADVTQVVAIHPSYTNDEEPYEGEVTIHALHADSGHFAEAEVRISAREMAKICAKFLATLDADQDRFLLMSGDDEDDEDDEDEEDGDEDGEDEEDEEDEEGDEDEDEDEDEEGEEEPED